jgi:hypothetical protein
MRAAAIAAAFAALALTGCSASVGTSTKIDAGKAEDLVRKVAGSGRIQLKSVTCPDGQEAKKGETFDCDIAYVDGNKGTMTIHMTNDDGGVQAAASDIHLTGK